MLTTLSAALTAVDWGKVAQGLGTIALALLDAIF